MKTGQSQLRDIATLEKEVQFIIISQIQNKDGWAKYPLDEQLRANSKNQFISDV